MTTLVVCSLQAPRSRCCPDSDWQSVTNFFEIGALHFSPTVASDAPPCFLSRLEYQGAHWAIEIARRTGRRVVIAGNHANSGKGGRVLA